MPQLCASVIVSAHEELQHVFAVDGHVMPQPMQFAWSELSSTQLPLQQLVPAPHAWPHMPQLVPSVIVSMPSSVEPSQSSSRWLQSSGLDAGAVHITALLMQAVTPSAHTPIALAIVHGAPMPGTLSTVPSQSSSVPWFAHVSGIGMPEPMHVPQ